MTPDERALRQRLRDDFAHYAEKCLKLRSKQGWVLPFVMNEAQAYIHHALEEQRRQEGRVRAIILKGRQQGCSTYVQGRFYWRLTHQRGARVYPDASGRSQPQYIPDHAPLSRTLPGGG